MVYEHGDLMDEFKARVRAQHSTPAAMQDLTEKYAAVKQIIRDTGAEPVVRVADTEEYRDLLRAKLVEEVNEFLASDDPNELADVLEVLLALAGDLGVDRDQLEKLRAAKAFERGGFADRIVWSGNTPAGGCAAYAGLTSSA